LCLLDAVDSLKLPSRDVSKPLILPICDVIKSQSTGQLAAFGKLGSGAIRNGSKVYSFKTFSTQKLYIFIYCIENLRSVATVRIG
jgi:translation elongation factor EF-1alpha